MAYRLADRIAFVGVLLAAFCIHGSLPSKVLFFNGMGEGSHYSVASGLAEELHAHGHSVAFIIGDQYKHRAEDPVHRDMFTFRIVENTNATAVKEVFEIATTTGFEGENAFQDPTFVGGYEQALVKDCEAIFDNRKFLRDLREEHFDLMVCDPCWPCSVILGDYLRTERVALIIIASAVSFVDVLGGTVSPAVVPQFVPGLSQEMTFFERVHNVMMSYMLSDLFLELGDSAHAQICADHDLPGFVDSLRDINTYIVTADNAFDYVIPRLPGHVDAAGLTVRPPAPLEEDLEAFMQSAGAEGVVIFSLGSYVTHMPDRFVAMFREAFSRIPQRVIWQWRGRAPPEDMPQNVKCMDWLPQQDLLAHNQTKLLIYHGGNNGVYEAIHYEVPMLVMPLLADQFDVARRVVDKGIGMRLDPREVTTERIVKNINTILREKGFKDNVSRLSAIIRDRPLPPRKRAVSMIEHVLKFGSSHLRSPAHGLSSYQFCTIDVHAFILAVLVSVVFVVYKVSHFFLKILLGFLRKRKTKAD